MTTQGNATQKIRPILQAMERSIESARARRTQRVMSDPRPESPRLRLLAQQPGPATMPSITMPNHADAGSPLKARPKRTA